MVRGLQFGGMHMVINGYTVQRMRDGYWITRLAPNGDRALPTNLEIDLPLRSVARTILDDCGYDALTDAAEEFAKWVLAALTVKSYAVLTIPASRIDCWVASQTGAAPR